MLSVVKMRLGGCALNDDENYIVDNVLAKYQRTTPKWHIIY